MVFADALYRFGRIDSPDCPRCGLQPQTPFRLLMGCDAFVEECRQEQCLGGGFALVQSSIFPGSGDEGGDGTGREYCWETWHVHPSNDQVMPLITVDFTGITIVSVMVR